jgi:signal transduction histidine kinase
VTSPKAPLDAPPESETPFGAGHLLHHGTQVALANFVIAGLIATMHGGRLGTTLVYAECIGLSIWLLVEFGRHFTPQRTYGWPRGWRGVALVAVACALGYVIGTTLADAMLGFSSWGSTLRHPSALLQDFGPTATFCTIVAGWFYVRGQARAQRAQMAAAAHAATLARLNLLQSQLEPHMLFNTLANLRVLIAADPARAQEMLDRLIDFLRATLVASRVASHPLATEFARVDDYLALMRVRMGDRLVAITSLPSGLAALQVPPLLLQPLVENAIKHGLEPQRGAGQIAVTATLEGTTLVLAVVDSGRGLEAAAAANALEPAPSGAGFGVAQVRERLHTLHGDAASFTLAPAAPRGTRAEIRLPTTLEEA